MTRSSVACSGVVAAPSAAGGAGPSPSDSVVAETAAGQSAAAGTAATYARGDHTHGTPPDPLPAHIADGDPHPQYQQAGDVDAAIDGALVDHVAAVDPHPGYQRESEKGQANGYAGLGADGKVPAAQLPASGGGGPNVKSGVVNLGAGGTAAVTFNTPFASVPVVVVSSLFNTADTSTTLCAHTVTVNGFTLRGAGNLAGNVAWIATDAGNP